MNQTGVDYFNQRHHFAFSGGWNLPFDRAWSQGSSRLTDGWTQSPIATMLKGGATAFH